MVPFVIGALILSADLNVLLGWFKMLVLVKLFSVFWAVGDRVWNVVFKIAAGSGNDMRWVWDMPALWIAAAVEVVLVPVLAGAGLALISGKTRRQA